MGESEARESGAREKESGVSDRESEVREWGKSERREKVGRERV